MKRKHVLALILAAAFAAGLGYFYGGSQVPAGQPALESLTSQNVGGIKTAFNAANGSVRVIVLLSPT
jgi:hypothetical protein